MANRATMRVLAILGCIHVAAAQTPAAGAGCSDSAAANFNAASATDDGSCVYGDCASLRARLKPPLSAAVCFVFNGSQPEDRRWPLELRNRATASACGAGRLKNVTLAPSDKWVVQG